MAHFRHLPSGRVRAEVETRGVRKAATLPTLDHAKEWARTVEEKAILKHAMAAAVEHRFLMSSVPRRVLQAMADIPFTKADIIGGAVHLPQRHGIYFLIRDGEVKYVGKSADVLGRIQHHTDSGWIFDSINAVFCKKEDMTDLEKTYIEAFMPDWNQQIGGPAKGMKIATRKNSGGKAFVVETGA